jgi:pyruvate, water dikinase
MNDAIYTLDFSEVNLADIARVGGKNASLGEMWQSLRPLGVNVLDGFATTSEAYRRLLAENDLEDKLRSILSNFDPQDTDELQIRGQKARAAVLETPLPEDLRAAFLIAYTNLCMRLRREPELAVRSSATAEDLPEASFAGAAETFLNVRGGHALLQAIHKCFASLFTDRAISYRAQLGYDHLKVALSVGVQPMVRSDLASSGVMFTLDTESGFRNVIEITSSYGLGEFVVQGVVSPDEWTVFKTTLVKGHKAIIDRRLGTKEVKLVFAGGTRGTKSEAVKKTDRKRFSLTDEEVLKLANWACLVEVHYSALAGHATPMDIEWAKDGATGELFIVQARPETVHSAKQHRLFIETYRLKAKPSEPLVIGQAVGEKIGAGRVRIVTTVDELSAVEEGDVLVASSTNPDWEPVMKRVGGIVTDQGGRTAHAAIVSRELGLPCIVGCGNATEVLQTGDEVTISCAEGAEGKVYAGRIPFEIEREDFSSVPPTQTKVMFNVADPSQALKLAALPNDGVGLARLEFIITNQIGIHPMALALFPHLKDKQAKVEIAKRLSDSGENDSKEFFVRRLAEGVGKIAAAFYPKPAIVRTSDFKTNEYARLLGGSEFEPEEENPMIGFRGASRYYDERYREGFALECAALKRVRNEMGLTNVKVMIPFCRTVTEARLVIGEMAKNGLKQGENDLEIYAMCELPSNVVNAKEFLGVFDGYSIGSNDLTQLILGIDRDSGTIAGLFDEDDKAVKEMIAQAIETARVLGKPIGICGQAPSDKPEFAAWLVRRGITSISLTPDSALRARGFIQAAEARESLSEPASEMPRQTESIVEELSEAVKKHVCPAY